MRMSDPYERFDRLKNATVVSGLTLTFGAARYFHNQLPQSVDQLASTIFLLAYALIPLMLWLAISYVVVPIVLERRFFRKMVLGRRYVEGTWIEWIRGPAGKEEITIFDIQPDKETFVLLGFNNNEQGFMNNPFRVTLRKFDWPYLYYCYESTTGGSSGEHQGVGVFHFSTHQAGFRGAPTYFTGSFSPGGAPGSHQVVGKRLSDEECMQMASEKEKRALIAKYLSDFRAKDMP